MFLMLSLYMQQVLGLSPLETGVGYLAVAGTAIIWANVAAAAVTRVGVKPALVFGMALFTVGLLYFSIGLYFMLTNDLLFLNTPEQLITTSLQFIIPLGIFFVARAYRRRQGLPIDAVFREIPPE